MGEAVQDVMRVGDALRCLRNPSGDFHYSLVRASEAILSAGAVGGIDEGGPVAVWQECDKRPNPNIEEFKKTFPKWLGGEWVRVQRPYVTVSPSSSRGRRF